MLPQRRSLRSRTHDYARPASYFVTICSAGREPLFGTIADGAMHRSPVGEAVEAAWRWLGVRYPTVELGEWVVMPNHVHGILTVGTPMASAGASKPLGSFVAALKANATQRVNMLTGSRDSHIWQRGYHECIVRTDDELLRTRRYIRDNPRNWPLGAENPVNLPRASAGERPR